MLSAVDEYGNVINSIEDIVNVHLDYFCPLCQSRVYFKKGRIKQAHFAHRSLGECHFYSENESHQHLTLKSILYRWFKKERKVRVEAYISQINQIADLLIEDKIAIEVQCSSLPIERLKKRTQSYHQNDFVVLWLLGQHLWLKDRLTPLQKQFLYFSRSCGFFLWELDLERELIRLKYMIHEDLKGKAHYLTKVFPFYKDSLLSILRFPYQVRKVISYSPHTIEGVSSYIRKKLYFRDSKWMRKQEELYERGDNLLLKSDHYFYPQIRPVQSRLGFTQIKEDISNYDDHFLHYYKKEGYKKKQIVYSPYFYDKIKDKGDKNGTKQK